MARPNRWLGLEPDNSISSGLHPWVREVLRTGGFVIRHGIAGLLTVAVPCVLWTVVYVVLLIFAMFDGRTGSPAAYPVGLLVIFLLAVVMVVTTIFPATALAEWISRKRNWSTFAQIPLSIAFAVLLAFLVCHVVQMLEGGAFGFQDSVRSSSIYVLFCLLPLGFYWWIAQSGPLLLRGWRCLRSLAKK